MWVLLLAMVLAPGRYAGTTPEGGRVWIELVPGGTGSWDGVPGVWALKGHTLRFGERIWSVVPGADGPCLAGPGGPICLRYAAPPERRAPALQRPEAFAGLWRHSASGGTLTLFLAPPGMVVLIEQGPEGMPTQTMGRWHAEGGDLVLTMGDGPPLRYRVARVGAQLALSGGDLPVPVRFGPVEADGGSPL